jgi:hypothetical protein
MEILELPQERAARKQFDFRSLSDVLFESADLLEEARESDDVEFKAAALDLAIRSLYTASTALDRFIDHDRRRQPASETVTGAGASAAVLAGPWATESL